MHQPTVKCVTSVLIILCQILKLIPPMFPQWEDSTCAERTRSQDWVLLHNSEGLLCAGLFARSTTNFKQSKYCGLYALMILYCCLKIKCYCFILKYFLFFVFIQFSSLHIIGWSMLHIAVSWTNKLFTINYVTLNKYACTDISMVISMFK